MSPIMVSAGDLDSGACLRSWLSLSSSRVFTAVCVSLCMVVLKEASGSIEPVQL